MPELVVAFFGDVVGEPGRRAFARAAAAVRSGGVTRGAPAADLVIVNGENAKHGSGLSESAYRSLRSPAGPTGAPPALGADAITLGDHAFREKQVIPLLESADEPVCRPANWAPAAPGKRSVRIAPVRPGMPPIHVFTVLGRLGMSVFADCPFASTDREASAIEAADPDALVIVEVHAEATSEKQALAWHCLSRWPGRVIAVVGTHTHVQTADARILEGRLAAITDLGMTGPHRSVIGRRAEDAVRAIMTQTPVVLDVADGEEAACGVLIRIDTAARRAVGIEAIRIG